jgi:hypothetical protein
MFRGNKMPPPVPVINSVHQRESHYTPDYSLLKYYIVPHNILNSTIFIMYNILQIRHSNHHQLQSMFPVPVGTDSSERASDS